MRLLFIALVVLTVLSGFVLSLMSEESLLQRTAGRNKQLPRMKPFDRESKNQPSKLHGSARPNGKMGQHLANVATKNDGPERINGKRAPFNRHISNGINRRRNPLLEHKRNIAQSKFAALEAIRQQKQRQFEAQQLQQQQLFQQQQQQQLQQQKQVTIQTAAPTLPTIQPKN